MTVLGAYPPTWSGHSAGPYAPGDLDALADRLPPAPLRVGLGDRDAGDVGADDGAALAHGHRRPGREDLLRRAHARAGSADGEVGVHGLGPGRLRLADRLLALLDLGAVVL